MNKLFAVMVSVLLMSGTAFADEPAVVNDPSNAWDNFKQAVSVLEPSVDVLHNAADNDFHVGSSVRLFTLEQWKYTKWVDLRVGWSETKIGYGTLSLALDRVTGVDVLKHAHLGFWGGRDFDGDEFGYGLIAGAKGSF